MKSVRHKLEEGIRKMTDLTDITPEEFMIVEMEAGAQENIHGNGSYRNKDILRLINALKYRDKQIKNLFGHVEQRAARITELVDPLESAEKTMRLLAREMKAEWIVENFTEKEYTAIMKSIYRALKVG